MLGGDLGGVCGVVPAGLLVLLVAGGGDAEKGDDLVLEGGELGRDGDLAVGVGDGGGGDGAELGEDDRAGGCGGGPVLGVEPQRRLPGGGGGLAELSF